MRRSLRFLAVMAPILSCAALAACTADDDDEIVVPAPDADLDDASLGDATVALPLGDATVQMDNDAMGDDDEASVKDSGRDGGESDATMRDAEAGITDSGHDAADAHDAEADADAGHDSGVDAAPPPPPPTFTLGGTITGLPFTDTVVLDNGADTVSTTQDIPIFVTSASFKFPKAIATGTMYNVTVGSSSSDLHCTVANGTGTITADVTNVAVACVNAYWVNPATGSDANAGTSNAPFKTLTFATKNAPSAGAYFTVEPGVYNVASGETFPLLPKSNQTFVGDVANAGAGPTPTQIIGSGTSGAFTGTVVLTGVTNVSMSGLLVGAVATATTGAGGAYGMIVDDSSATLASNNFGSDGATDLAIENGSLVTLTSNTLTGNATATLSIADPTTAVTARSNELAGPKDIVVSATATLAKLDFGTAASLGNNTIVQGGTAQATGFTGLTVNAAAGTLPVEGNIWTPSVQGADANGRYATALVAGAAPIAGNLNYIVATGASLQF